MPSDMEEKEAIRELFSEYSFRMDDGRYGVPGGVADLFTEDGWWEAKYARAEGQEEIASLLARINPDHAVGPARKHYVVNSLIRLDGDRATSRASYLVFVDGGSGPESSVTGTYHDELVKLDGSWRFQSRRLVHDIAGELGLRL